MMCGWGGSNSVIFPLVLPGMFTQMNSRLLSLDCEMALACLAHGMAVFIMELPSWITI